MKLVLKYVSLLAALVLVALTTGCGKEIMKTEVVYSPDTTWTYDTTVIPAPAPKLEVTFGEVTEPVYFDYDSYTLKAESKETLSKIGEFLEKNAPVSVKIEGHCDERGTHGYNQALGQKRADAVKNYFVNFGISSSRLSTVSYGELKPAVEGTSEEAYAKNRRSEMNEK